MNQTDISALEAEIYAQNEHNNPGVSDPVDLGKVMLIAGFLIEIQFVDRINQICPKTSHHHVSHGVVAALIVCLIGSGMYDSTSAASRALKEHSQLLEMFGHKASDVYYVNRDIMGETLHALWATTKLDLLYREIAMCCVDHLGLGDQITQLVIDGTNDISFKSKTEAGANGKICVNQGKSKVHRDDLPQYSTFGICSPNFAGLLAMKVRDGNTSDVKGFFELLDDSLGHLTQALSNAKYVTGDSKLFTVSSIALIRAYGLHAATRAPDILKFVKQAQANTDDLKPIYSATEVADDRRRNKHNPLGKWIDAPDLLVPQEEATDGAAVNQAAQTIPIRALLVKNPGLEPSKKRSLTKKAKREQEQLSKELQHKFLCGPDAQAAVEAAQAKAKYCTIKEIRYDIKLKQSRRGRPSKDSSSNKIKIASVAAVVEVSIDQARLSQLIERECLYVIITTDVERNWTMRELLELYHGNSVIEHYWRSSKSDKLLPRISLENEDRIETLFWLKHIAVLARCVIEYKLREVAKEDPLVVPPPHEPNIPETKVTIERVMNYLDKRPVCLLFNQETGKAYFTNLSTWVKSIFRALGPTWIRLLSPNLYKMEHFNIVHG